MRAEDGGFERICADALARAGVSAVALGGEARVVAVPMFSSGGSDADAVAPAGDESGAEVIGVGVGRAAVMAVAELGEQGLGPVEEDGVDEGSLGLVTDAAK